MEDSSYHEITTSEGWRSFLLVILFEVDDASGLSVRLLFWGSSFLWELNRRCGMDPKLNLGMKRTSLHHVLDKLTDNMNSRAVARSVWCHLCGTCTALPNIFSVKRSNMFFCHIPISSPAPRGDPQRLHSEALFHLDSGSESASLLYPTKLHNRMFWPKAWLPGVLYFKA